MERSSVVDVRQVLRCAGQTVARDVGDPHQTSRRAAVARPLGLVVVGVHDDDVAHAR